MRPAEPLSARPDPAGCARRDPPPLDMQEAHGDGRRPNEDEPTEQPRLELRLDGEDGPDEAPAPRERSAPARADEPRTANERPARPPAAPFGLGDGAEEPRVDAPSTEPLEPASLDRVSLDGAAFDDAAFDGAAFEGQTPAADGRDTSSDHTNSDHTNSDDASSDDTDAGSHGFVAAQGADHAEDDVVVDGPPPPPAPLRYDPSSADAAFEAADAESFEQAVDEVLVFQMDEDEEGPQMPEGFDEQDSATYSELSDPSTEGGEHDEFSELGATWDARLEGEEDPFAEPEPIDRRRQVALAAGAGALIAVLMFVFDGGADEPQGGDGSGVEVARSESSAGGAAGRTPSAAAAAGNGATGNGATGNGGAESSTARDTAAPEVDTAPSEPRTPRSMVAGLGELFAPFAGTPVEEGVRERDPSAVASLFGGDQSRDRREGFIAVEDQVVLPDPLPNLQMADASAFAHLWLEPGLPPGGVEGERYLQTPVFGYARVHTSAKEFFDGRLVGLGAGRIALTTNAGELTLAGDRVVKIESLVPGQTAGMQVLVASTTGERVRVRAAGGWLRGEVVREDEESVTLLLESGGRITVDRSIVRPAAEGQHPRLAEPPVAG